MFITFQRLQQINFKCSGKLYGLLFENTLLIVGLSINVENAQDVTNSFPTEVDMCGMFDIDVDSLSETELIKRLSDIDVTDNPVYLSRKLSNKIVASFVKNNTLEETSYSELSKDEVQSQFIYMRLKAEYPFMCELTSDSIKETVVTLRKLFTSGVMAFTLAQTNVYLLASDNENGIVGLSGDHTIGELSNESLESNEGIDRKKKLNAAAGAVVMEVDMFKKMTLEGPSVFTKPHGPIFILDKRELSSYLVYYLINQLILSAYR